jgi:hypothetical protein
MIDLHPIAASKDESNEHFEQQTNTKNRVSLEMGDNQT